MGTQQPLYCVVRGQLATNRSRHNSDTSGTHYTTWARLDLNPFWVDNSIWFLGRIIHNSLPRVLALGQIFDGCSVREGFCAVRGNCAQMEKKILYSVGDNYTITKYFRLAQ